MIVIVGAGVAGLSLGWRLALRGASVTILESGEIGSGASGVASAYLEPRLGSGYLRKLEWAAFREWPDFADTVEAESDVTIDYRRDGQIRTAYSDTLSKVKADAQQRQDEGWTVDWLERRELVSREPFLSEDVVAGAYLPDVCWLDGKLLCDALASAITRRGSTVIEHTRAQSIAVTGGRVRGVMTPDGVVPGEKIVLCAGTGTNLIDGMPGDIPVCRPVRGVVLTMGMDPEAPILRHLIRRPDGFLCPRSNGNLLVGSTHDDGETCLTPDADVIEDLKARAARTLPAIAELPLLNARAGLRTFVGDGLLRLGRSQQCRGLYYSLSHAGAGFLRAPVISRELADFVLSDEAACPHIGPFLKR